MPEHYEFPKKRYLRKSECVRMTGIHPATIQFGIRAGHIKTWRAKSKRGKGSVLAIDPESFEEWVVGYRKRQIKRAATRELRLQKEREELELEADKPEKQKKMEHRQKINDGRPCED
jgi:hypothetical protein